MSNKDKQNGFGLVEVLVALLVILVGLLGLAAVQMKASQAEMESFQRTQALILVEDMVNRIRSNSAFATCYELPRFEIDSMGTGYAVPDPDPDDDEGDIVITGCNLLTDRDLLQWNNLLIGAAEDLDGVAVGAMIGARGCIELSANIYTVTIAWQGLAPTTEPDNACGEDEYGDERLRRTVSHSFLIGNLI